MSVKYLEGNTYRSTRLWGCPWTVDSWRRICGRSRDLMVEAGRNSQTGMRWCIRFRTLTWTVDLWRGIITWSHRLMEGCRIRNHWSSQCSEHCRLYDRMRQTAYETRQSDKLYILGCKSNFAMRLPLIAFPKIWNKWSPIYSSCTSRSKFKKCIKASCLLTYPSQVAKCSNKRCLDCYSNAK